MRILITGGAGFIGSHLVAEFLEETNAHLTLIDRLDCSGNLNRLVEAGCPHPRVRFVYHDLKAPISEQVARQVGEQDYILHLGAATHVDRSIEDPLSFVMDNVVATCNLLDHARKAGCKKFLYFSTDEVFGPAPEGTHYSEWDRYKSGNPYAATKAGGEELAIAYHNTYGVPVLVTHTMNVIGPMQHWEKYVPSTVRKVLTGEEVTIHADKTCTTPGSRFYIHARNVARAVRFLLNHGEVGDKYNIVGEKEMNNLELAEQIAKIVGKPLKHRLVNFHESRPGHDLRYALSGEKMRLMGWSPPMTIEQSLRQTVQWYLAHPEWLGLERPRIVA